MSMLKYQRLRAFHGPSSSRPPSCGWQVSNWSSCAASGPCTGRGLQRREVPQKLGPQDPGRSQHFSGKSWGKLTIFEEIMGTQWNIYGKKCDFFE